MHFGPPLILFVAVMACATTAYGGLLPVRTIAKGAFGRIAQARQEVVRDMVAWGKTRDQLDLKAPPDSKIPEIDFAREMVLVVTMGQQRTGGYAVEIVRVEIADNRLRIWVSRKSPPPGAMVIQVLTSPFHIVAVPKSALKPEFVRVKEAGRHKGVTPWPATSPPDFYRLSIVH